MDLSSSRAAERDMSRAIATVPIALASLRGRPVPPHDGIRGSGAARAVQARTFAHEIRPWTPASRKRQYSGPNFRTGHPYAVDRPV